MKRQGDLDRSTLRFSSLDVSIARLAPENPSGPLWGELNVLIYGCPTPPQNEEWRLYLSVPWDNAEYWVSDLGHFCVWREKDARLWEGRSYPQAVVYYEGRKVPRDIHILVAKSFCEWGPGHVVVRHLNSNRNDFHANNLKPGTIQENVQDRQNRARGLVPRIDPPLIEEWRLSNDYAGVRVSNLGGVRLGWWSLFNTRGYTIKVGTRAGLKKHLAVTFRISRPPAPRITRGLHRIIWESFHGPIPDGAYVRHLNDDPHDNRLANLAIGTSKQNAQDRGTNGHQRYGEAHPHAKYSDFQRALLIELIGAGYSIAEAARVSMIKPAAAYRIAQRAANGLQFIY